MPSRNSGIVDELDALEWNGSGWTSCSQMLPPKNKIVVTHNDQATGTKLFLNDAGKWSWPEGDELRAYHIPTAWRHLMWNETLTCEICRSILSLFSVRTWMEIFGELRCLLYK